MTIKKLFEYIAKVKPNAFGKPIADDDSVLLRWLSEAEGMIQMEILLTSPADVVTYESVEATKTVTVSVTADSDHSGDRKADDVRVTVRDVSGDCVLNLTEGTLECGESYEAHMTNVSTGASKTVEIERKGSGDENAGKVYVTVTGDEAVEVEPGEPHSESGLVPIELLVPAPYDRMYYAYIEAMIDFQEGEYAAYANTLERYNAELGEYSRWVGDNVRPALGRACLEGYYLSAYAIAVKHGYEGTEEEWAQLIIDAGENARRAEEACAASESAATSAAGSAQSAGQDASAALDAKKAALDAKKAAEDAQSAAEEAATAVANPPYIGESGNWYVWDKVEDEFVDSGVKATGATGQTGATGATGNGIASIEKTASSLNVDTYTITYTNGTTMEFTVTNGQDGASGADGADGADGFSPVVTVTPGANGNTVNIEDDSGDHTFFVPNGTNGANGNKIYVGTAVDSAGTGASGYNVDDVYINNSSWNVYYVESPGSGAKVWHFAGNIRGAAGQNGTNGTNGQDGRDGNLWYVGSTLPGSTSGVIVGDLALIRQPASGTGLTDWNLYVYDESTPWNLVGNIKGADGSDASVTSANITSALGYTPVSSSDVSTAINAAIGNAIGGSY